MALLLVLFVILAVAVLIPVAIICAICWALGMTVYLIWKAAVSIRIDHE
jgi:hypothetical protein